MSKQEVGIQVRAFLASTCIHEDGFVQYPPIFNPNPLPPSYLYSPGTPTKCQSNKSNLKPNCNISEAKWKCSNLIGKRRMELKIVENIEIT